MKTAAELNSHIIQVTMQLNEWFPELYQYIGEMPITIPNEANPAINLAALHDYYDSLTMLLNRYAQSHIAIGFSISANPTQFGLSFTHDNKE